MAEQLDLAAILQSLSQPSKPDIWQALGTLGQGLSAAGRTTVGRPAQETVGGALGGFAGSLAQTRQQDQANKLRQLQTLSAVSQLQAVDKKQKRDKYFEDNKDGLVGSFESVMSKTQYEALKTMAKYGDSDSVLNFIKDYAKTDATGQAAARIAQIKGDFQKAQSTIGKINADFKAGGMSVAERDAAIAKATGESDLVKMARALTDKESQFGAPEDAKLRNSVLNPNSGASARISELADALKSTDLQTGDVQNALSGLQGIADDLEISLEDIAKKVGLPNLGKIDKKQQFDRLTKGVVTELAQNFKGSLSNKELDFLRSASAGLGRSEKDNIRAVAAMKAAEELASNRREDLMSEEEKTPKDRRSALDRFRRKRGKRDARFLRSRAKEIETEITSARNANTGLSALSNSDLVSRISTAGADDLDKIMKEIERRKGGGNGN